MPDLTELLSQGLSEEATPQVDWEAPPAGSTPPVCKPGSYRFRFKMPAERKDWYSMQAIEVVKGQPKRNFMQMHYEAEIIGDGAGHPWPANEVDGSQPTLKNQRASFYRTEKQLISFGAELIRANGVKITGALNPQSIDQALTQMDGQTFFEANVIWRTYFKDTDTTISTAPNKKRGELPWPKDASGEYELMVAPPSGGQKQYGYPEIKSPREIKQ